MATMKPTSRQLKGHFDALRPSKSHSASATIDIAAGTYGSFKTFGGSTGVSHPSWVGATDTFYVYLDKNDSLVLNGTNFPDLSTRIGRVVLAAGIILDVIDDRAEVNGLIDAYQVAFDDGYSNIAFGDSVQEALESLDAYIANELSVAINETKFVNFGFQDGILNGRVLLTQISDSPALEFQKRASGIARVRYSIAIPSDYVTGTDVIIKAFWSPPDGTTGDIRWRIRYRLVASDLENIDTAMTTVIFDQASPAITNRLTDTGNNLNISSGSITPGDILIFNLEREYTSASDTYASEARVHLVRMEYTGRGVK